LRNRLLQLAGPVVQFAGLHALQDVLVLRLALAAAQLQVLHRPQEQRDAGNVARLAPQALDHLLHRHALAARLQVDEHAAGVQRGPLPPPLTELTVNTFGSTRIIAANFSCSCTIAGNEMSSEGFGAGADLADVFLRGRSLRNRHEQPHRGHQRGHPEHQHRPPVAQRGVEPVRVGREHRVEAALERAHQRTGRFL